jgi:soluble cytochrome b562
MTHSRDAGIIKAEIFPVSTSVSRSIWGRMKSRLLMMSCALCLFLPVRAEEETALGKQMDAMNQAFKSFRKETDPAKCAALARDAQQAVAKSLLELPELVVKMPEGPAKAKSAAEYRKMMGRLYVSLCEVEEAYLAGKAEDAAKILASLKDVKKQGHDKFMEEE